ncbi:MAG: metallophosphoesterase [Petrotogaceae bacterium]|jgi:UDP-2,3-diacylglucosamine pyrophosphatase LpxH|nr:metallophosphoesterase [Petrotogaceae bacterium]
MKLYISDTHIGENSDRIYDEKLLELFKKTDDRLQEVVIVGDFLELIDSTCIKADSWDVQEHIKLLDKIYSVHSELFNRIKNLSEKIEISYVYGNHDYMVGLCPEVSSKIRQMMGNINILPYHYDEKTKVFAIHGNQFDVFNRFSLDESGKLVNPVGERLINYIAHGFISEMSQVVPEEILRDYVDVYPSIDVPKWFSYLSKVYRCNIKMKKIFVNTFVDFCNSQELKQWLDINYPDSRALLKIAVNKYGGTAVSNLLARMILAIKRIKNSNYLMKKSESLLCKEFLIDEKYVFGYGNKAVKFNTSQVQGIIMGHNHLPALKDYNGKFYANTGSWKDILIFDKKNENKFIEKKRISYIEIENTKYSLEKKLVLEEI